MIDANAISTHFSTLLVLSASIVWSSNAVGASYPPIYQPGSPQTTEECEALNSAWKERVDGLSSENLECERAEGARPNGVSVSAKGVFLPNCGYRQQAYMSCAKVQDQQCRASKERAAGTAQCYSAVSAAQRQRREAETAAAKLQRKIDETKSAAKLYQDALSKGPINTAIDRMTETPSGAATRFESAIKEAARTTGAAGADSQPQLSKVGEMSDEVYRLVPGNPAAAELGSQSAAAARARMADALNQLEGATTRTTASDSAGFRAPATLPAPTSTLERGRSEGPTADVIRARQERQEARAAEAQERQDSIPRLEMLRQMNEAAQQALERARASQNGGGTGGQTGARGYGSSNSTGTPRPAAGFDPRCQTPDGRARPPGPDGRGACTVK